MRFQDKVALVTGGGSGIGRETAISLAKEGAEVLCVDVSEGRCRQTIELAAEAGARMGWAQADISSATDVEAAFRECTDRHGKLDIVCHCAAVLMDDQNQLVDELDMALWERIISTNLTGTFLVCKHAVKAMKLRRQGVIVNMASTAALQGNPYHAYTASKGGVVALSRAMASTYAADNIRVNVVCPGPVDTAMMGGMFGDPQVREAYRTAVPLGRIGHPAEIAQMILYLASDDASWVTGNVMVIDGGGNAR